MAKAPGVGSRRRSELRGRSRVFVAVAASALAVSACGGSSGGGDDDGPDDTVGDPNVLVGTFQVQLIGPMGETPGYTSVMGKVYDGAMPEKIVWEKQAEAGACQLLKPTYPFCSTYCGNNAVCVATDQCQAYPTAQTVGTVQVTGLHTDSGATSFAMDPIANTYQPPGNVGLPFPAFAEGDEIKFTAAGSAFNKTFAVTAKGISPLVVSNTSIQIGNSQPLVLSWTPAGQADISKIHVKLDISHHGGVKGIIECDTQDTGTLELSASLQDQLIALGVAGFPTIVVTRANVGATTISAGRVDLAVSSAVEMAVAIPGLISCTTPGVQAECPGGETCQATYVCG